MDLDERSELLDTSIKGALEDGLKTKTMLRLLLLMALRTDSGCDENLPPSQAIAPLAQLSVAIEINYGLAFRAILHRDPGLLDYKS